MGKMKFGDVSNLKYKVDKLAKPEVKTVEVLNTIVEKTETVVEKLQDIHHTTIQMHSKPDHRARKYAKVLSEKLHEKVDAAVEQMDDRLKHESSRKTDMVESLKSISYQNQVLQEKLKDLQKTVDLLQLIKPEEKQIVIENPKPNKMLLIGVGVSIILSLLSLIK